MPTAKTATPPAAINRPFIIHFGLEYIKDDVGPTTEFPCRKKIIPNAIIIMPTPIIGILAFMYVKW